MRVTEYLKYIKEKKPWIISVVISGYQDFSYAQQAIRYEAKRYLIKPSSKSSIMCASARIERPDFISKRNKKGYASEEVIVWEKNRLVGNSGYESRNSEEKIEFRNVYPVYMVAKAYLHI